MAFALLCIENAVRAKGIDLKSLSEIMDFLWTFVESNDLGMWDADVRDVAGEIMDHADYLENGSFPECQLPVDSELYLLGPAILKMIGSAIELALCELYGAIVGHSKATLAQMDHLLELCEKENYPVPDVSPVLFSKFSEELGWGDPFPPEKIREQTR